MSEPDIERCAAQLTENLSAAVARVLNSLGSQEPVVTEAMLVDLGIAATAELGVEAAWTRDQFRVEAIENVAHPGTVVFQPAPLTPWAREVLALSGKLADEAEETERERVDAGRGQD